MASRYSSRGGWKPSCTSGPGGDENEVGGQPGEEAEQHAPHEHLLVAHAERHLHELQDDVEDRTGCQGEEGDEHRLVDEGLADDRADERGAATDDAQHGK